VRLRRLLALVLAVGSLIFGLAACSSDDSAKSAGSAPAAADLAHASVIGEWAVKLKIDSQSPPVLDKSLKVGDEVTRQYVLEGGCNVDTVDCTVKRQSSAGESTEVWTREGPKLTYHVEAPVTLACTIDGKATPVAYDVSATFTLEVADAQQVGESWLATELAYTRDADLTPGATAAAKGCPTGKQTESGTGVPAQSSPATSAAPTTSATPTTGASQTTGP
jgi:hypothetical protein